MGRKKFDAVHRYFSYDPLTQISKCELCGRDLKVIEAVHLYPDDDSINEKDHTFNNRKTFINYFEIILGPVFQPGCHSSNLKNHMVSHHPEDFAVVKALNVSLRKDNSDANNTTTTSTTITKQESPTDCKVENTLENSEDETEWLDSEFISCQNSADNNPTSSQIDYHGDDTPTHHQQAVSAPKRIKTSNMNVSGTNRDNNKLESNMLFGKFIAAELGRFQGKERYIVMQKIMRILME